MTQITTKNKEVTYKLPTDFGDSGVKSRYKMLQNSSPHFGMFGHCPHLCIASGGKGKPQLKDPPDSSHRNPIPLVFQSNSTGQSWNGNIESSQRLRGKKVKSKKICKNPQNIFKFLRHVAENYQNHTPFTDTSDLGHPAALLPATQGRQCPLPGSCGSIAPSGLLC